MVVYYLVKCTNPKCREIHITAAKVEKRCNICGRRIKMNDPIAERKEIKIGGIL
jgi:hypothetical protein